MHLTHHEIEALVRGEKNLSGVGAVRQIPVIAHPSGQTVQSGGGLGCLQAMNEVVVDELERALRILDEVVNKVGGVVFLKHRLAKSSLLGVRCNRLSQWHLRRVRPAPPGRDDHPVALNFVPHRGHHTLPTPGV